tara:strand:- start:360 stop:668 length:309 start_codon:yes stop_codon:yes gene_type:complete
MKKESFSDKCYNILKQVPKGKITTYKDLGNALNTKAYRAVGNALKKNPQLGIIPCHRVINTNGEIGGFAKGNKKKIQMLKSEGIEIKNGQIKDFNKYIFKFK